MSWTHLSDKTVTKSRKRYVCGLCGQYIPLGSSYVNRTGIGDYGFESHAYHVPCEKIAKNWSTDDWESHSAGDGDWPEYDEKGNEVTGHTPGPWQAGRSDMATIVDGYESKWIYAGDTYVAVASGVMLGWGEVIANANLIAAAPDLLAALERIVNECRVYCEGSEDIDNYAVDQARQAIRKAKGELQ